MALRLPSKSEERVAMIFREHQALLQVHFVASGRAYYLIKGPLEGRRGL